MSGWCRAGMAGEPGVYSVYIYIHMDVLRDVPIGIHGEWFVLNRTFGTFEH